MTHVRVLGVALVCSTVVGCGSDGYTPEYRAAQLVTSFEKQRGYPPAEIKCSYAFPHGDTRAWYVCQPGDYEVTCDKRTTDEPLTGPMTQPASLGDWGDCWINSWIVDGVRHVPRVEG